MTVAAILQNKGADVVTAEVGQKVSEIVALLSKQRIGAVPVMSDGNVVGVVSERDIIYGLAEHGSTLLDRPVEDIMTAPAVTVEPEQTALRTLALITRRRIRHLPVIEGGKLVGIVSIGDLVKRRIDGIENEANALREYIQQI